MSDVDNKETIVRSTRYYSVLPGTNLLSGPMGREGTIIFGKADEKMTVAAFSRPAIAEDGFVSIWVKVESPIEKKGNTFWLAKRLGHEGWIR